MFQIVDRELRVASRSRRTVINRSVAASVPLLIFLYHYAFMRSFYGALSGAGMFNTLMLLALFGVCFGGLRETSDAITSEKREGTLGLLFLTDLTGTDVIAGKFVAYGLRSAYGLLAMMPMIALSLLLGGVTFTEFASGCALLANTLFVSLAIGLACSTYCKKQNLAMGLASALMLAILAGGLIAQLVLSWFGIVAFSGADGLVWLHVLSPMVAFAKVSSSMMGMGVDSKFVWVHLAVTHALGWTCLFLARRAIKDCWKEVDTVGASARAGWRGWFRESTESMVAYRRRALDRGAYYWLVTRTRWQRVSPWATVVLAAVAFLVGFLADYTNMRHDMTQGFALFIIVGAHLVFRILLAGGAARLMTEDRLTGGLELTLGTPLTVKDLVRGHYCGIWRNYGAPFLAIIVMDAAVAFAFVQRHGATGGREELSLIFALIFNFVVDCVAIVPLGLWKVIDLKKPQHAAGTAGFRMLLVPGLIYVPIISVARPNSWEETLTVWLIINFLNALVNAGFSSQNLAKHLRERVANRFQSKTSVLSPS